MVPDSLQSAQFQPFSAIELKRQLLGRKRKGSFYIFERIMRTATADRIASRCIREWSGETPLGIDFCRR